MEYPASLQTKFSYGKHKGETVEDVIENDVTYIEWCMDNIPEFELEDEAYTDYIAAMEDYEDNKRWERGPDYEQ